MINTGIRKRRLVGIFVLATVNLISEALLLLPLTTVSSPASSTQQQQPAEEQENAPSSLPQQPQPLRQYSSNRGSRYNNKGAGDSLGGDKIDHNSNQVSDDGKSYKTEGSNIDNREEKYLKEDEMLSDQKLNGRNVENPAEISSQSNNDDGDDDTEDEEAINKIYNGNDERESSKEVFIDPLGEVYENEHLPTAASSSVVRPPSISPPVMTHEQQQQYKTDKGYRVLYSDQQRDEGERKLKGAYVGPGSIYWPGNIFWRPGGGRDDGGMGKGKGNECSDEDQLAWIEGAFSSSSSKSKKGKKKGSKSSKSSKYCGPVSSTNRRKRRKKRMDTMQSKPSQPATPTAMMTTTTTSRPTRRPTGPTAPLNPTPPPTPATPQPVANTPEPTAATATPTEA